MGPIDALNAIDIQTAGWIFMGVVGYWWYKTNKNK